MMISGWTMYNVKDLKLVFSLVIMRNGEFIIVIMMNVLYFNVEIMEKEILQCKKKTEL